MKRLAQEWQWLAGFLRARVDRDRAHHWMVMAVFISVFAIILRPVALSVVDCWNRQDMTDRDRMASYGLPFHVSKPPVGEGHILNRGQLRWVLMQEIRMNAMQSCLDYGNESAVRQFMQLVDDYNSRGADYRCELIDLWAAQEDVESYHEEIWGSAVAEAEAMGWDRPARDP